MKELELHFKGQGEVGGFEFTQLKSSDKGYLYEVFCPDISKIHYEVFRKKIAKESHTVIGGVEVHFPERVKYPTSNNMGDWAWTYRDYNGAIAKFEEVNNESDKLQGNENVDQSDGSTPEE